MNRRIKNRRQNRELQTKLQLSEKEHFMDKVTNIPQVVYLPVSDLTVIPEQNRPIVASNCKRLSREWDTFKMGVIEVNRRSDGTLFVCIGQHRVLVATGLFGPAFKVPVKVHEGLTEQQENELWLADTESKNVTPFEDHVKSLAAGRVEATRVENTLHKYGLHAATSNSTTGLARMAALRTAEHNGTLDRTLQLILEAWPTRGKDRWQSALITGISKVLQQPNVDWKKLVKVVAKETPETLHAEGKRWPVTQVPLGVALYLIKRHNSHKAESQWIPLPSRRSS
jgi:hypothetical protein